MSLVGPRPIVPDESKHYGDSISKLLSVRPGMTGNWQVNGRDDVGYPERVDLELWWVDNINLKNYVIILIKTIWPKVLKAR